MDAMPELADVETSQKVGAPEVQIEYDREQLARLGLDLATVAATVRTKVQGEVATRFTEGDREIDILVRSVQLGRASLADVQDMIVGQRDGRPIYLKSVADVRLAESVLMMQPGYLPMTPNGDPMFRGSQFNSRINGGQTMSVESFFDGGAFGYASGHQGSHESAPPVEAIKEVTVVTTRGKSLSADFRRALHVVHFYRATQFTRQPGRPVRVLDFPGKRSGDHDIMKRQVVASNIEQCLVYGLTIGSLEIVGIAIICIVTGLNQACFDQAICCGIDIQQGRCAISCYCPGIGGFT